MIKQGFMVAAVMLAVTSLGTGLAGLALAQGSRTIYAAVLSNKGFVAVGGENPGTGLYLVCDDGEWRSAGHNNVRTFAVEAFPQVGDGLIYTANGNGIFVSRDGGATWRVTSGWQLTEALEIAAHPRTPETVFAGTAYGLWKSTEMGENLQQMTGRFVEGLFIDVEDPNRIYIGEEDGIRYSIDGGRRFRAASGASYTVHGFGQHRARPHLLFAGAEDHGVLRSTDRGASWQMVGDATAGTTVYAIRIDANNPDRMFAATFAHGVLRSLDGGATWRAFTAGLQERHLHDLAIHPDNPDTLYAATLTSGLFRSTDGGESWQPFALENTQIYQIEIH